MRCRACEREADDGARVCVTHRRVAMFDKLDREVDRAARALALSKEEQTHREPAEATTLDRVMARRFAEALINATAPTGALLKAAFDYLEATEEKPNASTS